MYNYGYKVKSEYAPGVKVNPMKKGRSMFSIHRNQRLKWTTELHDYFVKVVDSIGGPFHARPKDIVDAMSIPGLTMNHIKSHLQKHRVTLKEAGLVHEGVVPQAHVQHLPPMASRPTTNNTTTTNTPRALQPPTPTSGMATTTIWNQGVYAPKPMYYNQNTNTLGTGSAFHRVPGGLGPAPVHYSYAREGNHIVPHLMAASVGTEGGSFKPVVSRPQPCRLAASGATLGSQGTSKDESMRVLQQVQDLVKILTAEVQAKSASPQTTTGTGPFAASTPTGMMSPFAPFATSSDTMLSNGTVVEAHQGSMDHPMNDTVVPVFNAGQTDAGAQGVPVATTPRLTEGCGQNHLFKETLSTNNLSAMPDLVPTKQVEQHVGQTVAGMDGNAQQEMIKQLLVLVKAVEPNLQKAMQKQACVQDMLQSQLKTQREQDALLEALLLGSIQQHL